MDRLRIGLVGAGAFGRNHARKVAGHPGTRLAAVFDPNPERAQAITEAFGGEAVADLVGLVERCDAAIIASPAGTHAGAALALLGAGRHVLVEKPIATTLDDAERMIAAARAAGVVLQVGHLERFQAQAGAITQATREARYLEARREGVWGPRGTDVSVVLDLMIHDIDLALQMAPPTTSPINDATGYPQSAETSGRVGAGIDAATSLRVEAIGAAVLSAQHDIAQARLVFPGGRTANLTASRIAPRVLRTLKLWGPGGQVAVDLVGRRLRRVAPGLPPMGGEPPGFGSEAQEWEAADALEAELAAFVAAVRGEAPVAVPGEAGRDALSVALAIMARIDETAVPWRSGAASG